MRPLMIFSFLSSSFLLLISAQGGWGGGGVVGKIEFCSMILGGFRRNRWVWIRILGLKDSERERERGVAVVGEERVGTDRWIWRLCVRLCLYFASNAVSLLPCSRKLSWGYLAVTQLGVVGGLLVTK